MERFPLTIRPHAMPHPAQADHAIPDPARPRLTLPRRQVSPLPGGMGRPGQGNGGAVKPA